MKIPRISIMIPLLVSGWLIAGEPVMAPSATTAGIVKTEKPLPALIPPEPKESEREPIRIGGLDTRAWTTIVGWNPGKSAFAEPKTSEAGLYLLSFGSRPPGLAANGR